MSNSSFWNTWSFHFYIRTECLGSSEFLRIVGNVSLTKPDCLHQALHWHTSTGWLSCDLPQQSLAWCSLPNWFYLYLTSSIDNSGSSKDVNGANQDRSNREHRGDEKQCLWNRNAEKQQGKEHYFETPARKYYRKPFFSWILKGRSWYNWK